MTDMREEIIEHAKYKPPGGMNSGFFERFTWHQDYYKSTGEKEKVLFENAVLLLCEDSNPAYARDAFWICAALYDFHPKDWEKRVSLEIERYFQINKGSGFDPIRQVGINEVISKFNFTKFTKDLLSSYYKIKKEVIEQKITLRNGIQYFHSISTTLMQIGEESARIIFEDILTDKKLFESFSREPKELANYYYGYLSIGAEYFNIKWIESSLESYISREIKDELLIKNLAEGLKKAIYQLRILKLIDESAEKKIESLMKEIEKNHQNIPDSLGAGWERGGGG